MNEKLHSFKRQLDTIPDECNNTPPPKLETAAEIAHEINNPLSIIIGRSSIIFYQLEQDLIEIETIRQSLKKIEEAAFRIAKIAQSLRSSPGSKK